MTEAQSFLQDGFLFHKGRTIFLERLLTDFPSIQTDRAEKNSVEIYQNLNTSRRTFKVCSSFLSKIQIAVSILQFRRKLKCYQFVA